MISPDNKDTAGKELMDAIVCDNYGGPEMMKLEKVQKPVPADNEVLIHIRAVSVNDWDWGKMDGTSFFNRLTSGLKKPKHKILGSDVAGIVEAKGKLVTKFQLGDEVYGDLSGRWGGFAEFVCAPENCLEKKDPGMSFEQAAAIPQAAMLALQGLIDKGRLKRGQKILLNGAGGGVGTFAIQIAGLYDADVTVVDAGEKLDMLRSLGAKHTIDYLKEDFTKCGEQYDLILDTKTNRPLSHYLRVLKPEGKYVTVGGSLSRLFSSLVLIPFISLFSKKKVIIVMLRPNKDLAYMNQLFEAGKLKPVIDRPYSLNEVPDAFRVFARAAHKGKLVITVK